MGRALWFSTSGISFTKLVRFVVFPLNPIPENDRGNMLDFPKIRAVVRLQTKLEFDWHIIKFENFEALQMVDARGHLLQLWGGSNIKLFKKRHGTFFYYQPIQSFQIYKPKKLEFLEASPLNM